MRCNEAEAQRALLAVASVLERAAVAGAQWRQVVLVEEPRVLLQRDPPRLRSCDSAGWREVAETAWTTTLLLPLGHASRYHKSRQAQRGRRRDGRRPSSVDPGYGSSVQGASFIVEQETFEAFAVSASEAP